MPTNISMDATLHLEPFKGNENTSVSSERNLHHEVESEGTTETRALLSHTEQKIYLRAPEKLVLYHISESEYEKLRDMRCALTRLGNRFLATIGIT